MAKTGLPTNLKDKSVEQLLDMLGGVFFRLGFTQTEAERAFMDVAQLALEYYASKTFERMSAEDKAGLSEMMSNQHKTDKEKLDALWEAIAAKEGNERALAFMTESFIETINTYLDAMQDKVPSVKNIRTKL